MIVKHVPFLQFRAIYGWDRDFSDGRIAVPSGERLKGCVTARLDQPGWTSPSCLAQFPATLTSNPPFIKPFTHRGLYLSTLAADRVIPRLFYIAREFSLLVCFQRNRGVYRRIFIDLIRGHQARVHYSILYETYFFSRLTWAQIFLKELDILWGVSKLRAQLEFKTEYETCL